MSLDDERGLRPRLLGVMLCNDGSGSRPAVGYGRSLVLPLPTGWVAGRGGASTIVRVGAGKGPALFNAQFGQSGE